jgi:hypothetical protein
MWSAVLDAAHLLARSDTFAGAVGYNDILRKRSAPQKIMKSIKVLTREDVRRVNRDMISGQVYNTTGLSPASSKILRESKFTRDDINRAFAAARVNSR